MRPPERGRAPPAKRERPAGQGRVATLNFGNHTGGDITEAEAVLQRAARMLSRRHLLSWPVALVIAGELVAGQP